MMFFWPTAASLMLFVLHSSSALQPTDEVAELMSLSPEVERTNDAADTHEGSDGTRAKAHRLRFASEGATPAASPTSTSTSSGAPTPPKTADETADPLLMPSKATCPEVVPQGGCCAVEGRIGVMPNMQNCFGHGQCVKKQGPPSTSVPGADSSATFLEIEQKLRAWRSEDRLLDSEASSAGLGNCKKSVMMTCQADGECKSDPANPCAGGCKCLKGWPNRCKCQAAPAKPAAPTEAPNYTVYLTEEQQLESLGSRAPEYMDGSAAPVCDLNLKTEYSVSKCNVLTYGCVVGSDGAEMWVKLGCAGVFTLGGKDLTCEGPSKEYFACNLLQEYFCKPGQGPPDKSVNKTKATGPIACAHACEDAIGCVAFDYASGIKKLDNCRLYDENKHGQGRTGLKENTGGLDAWKYCIVPPAKRKNACGTAGVCAECQCMAGWAGYGCEIDLANSGSGCLPMMPGCDTRAPAPPPCFGESPDFPETDPCRSEFRIHVPYPPEMPPTVGGLVPSWEANPYPAAWSGSEGSGSEGSGSEGPAF